MSDPLAHVGPSANYLRGYNSALGIEDPEADKYRVNFETIHSIAWREFEEGFMDAQEDMKAGCVLGGAVIPRN